MGRWNVFGISVLGFAMASIAMAPACGSDVVGGDTGAGGSGVDSGASTDDASASLGGTTTTDGGAGGTDASSPAAGGNDAAANPETGTPETSTGAGGASPEAAVEEASVDAAPTDAPPSTTVPTLGASDGAAPGLLCTFDMTSADASPAPCANWTTSNYNADGTITYVQDDVIAGNPTPGAIKLVTKFGTNSAVRARADFDPARDWSTLKTLHAYIKVLEPGDAQSIQLLVRTGPPNDGPSTYSSYDISTFPVGQFKEVTLSMATVQNNKEINRMGVQVTPKGADAGIPDAGLREATIVIDYVWVE